MTVRRGGHAWALVAVVAASGFAALGLTRPAWAFDPDDARARAAEAIDDTERHIDDVRRAVPRARQRTISAAERIAAGDIMVRTRDYERAIELLSQVLELRRQGQASDAAAADAEMLLTESYFKDGQLLSAGRHARNLLERTSESAYAPYAGRALSRLADVALRTKDENTVAQAVTYAARLPNTDPSGWLAYAKGKVAFASGDYAAARQSLASVPAGSSMRPQATYLVGVLLTKEAWAAEPQPSAAEQQATGAAQPGSEARKSGVARMTRFAPAVEQFRNVTKTRAETPEHRHVVDLAWMAMGRIFYETESYLDAADAYSHIGRTSPEFADMLQELAWVYAQIGDYLRAQRALEVLSITHPDSLSLADGSLLRADLLLRAGQFDKALRLYQGVRKRFGPIREQLAEFMRVNTEPAVYYDQMIAERLQRGGQADLQPLVADWARQEGENDRVFSLVDDVARSRRLIEDSRRLITQLDAVLSSPARAKAFNQVKHPLERTLGLINQIGKAYLMLARGMDETASSSVAGELQSVRAERRQLMRRMAALPVTPGDFLSREAAGERQWNRTSQRLQQLTIQVAKLEAMTVALRRVLENPGEHGVTLTEDSRQRSQAEVEANERDIQIYEERIDRLKRGIEIGRAQAGLGDQRYVDDRQVRQRFAQLLSREVDLAARGQDNSDAAEYAEAVRPLLQRGEAALRELDSLRERLEQLATDLAREKKEKMALESANLDQYSMDLDRLDQEARLRVGEAAQEHFARVNGRLRSIVLRADVGIVQQAWEVREEQRSRVRSLQRERAREEQALNDELREVLDDAEAAP